jgi:hypothetical protein
MAMLMAIMAVTRVVVVGVGERLMMVAIPVVTVVVVLVIGVTIVWMDGIEPADGDRGK